MEKPSFMRELGKLVFHLFKVLGVSLAVFIPTVLLPIYFFGHNPALAMCVGYAVYMAGMSVLVAYLIFKCKQEAYQWRLKAQHIQRR